MTVTSEVKNKLEFELTGVTQAFCNLLKEEVAEDEHVKMCTYVVDHPLIGKPKFLVETDTSTNPRKAVKDAIKRLKKINEKVRTGAKDIK